MKPLIVVNDASDDEGSPPAVERPIDLRRYQACGGRVRKECGGLHVTTAEQQWHYAVRFALDADVLPPDADVHACVRASVNIQRGTIGIGIVCPDGSTPYNRCVNFD